jgi:hypothetical protein
VTEHPFLTALSAATKACEEAEAEFRRAMNEKVAELAQARAFAHRRLNVMRALVETVQGNADRDAAVDRAVYLLRDRLGWREDSPARNEVLAKYRDVTIAAHAMFHPEEGDNNLPELGEALATFEDWYLEARDKPFWVLFEHYMPETQLVDF